MTNERPRAMPSDKEARATNERLLSVNTLSSYEFSVPQGRYEEHKGSECHFGHVCLPSLLHPRAATATTEIDVV